MDKPPAPRHGMYWMVCVPTLQDTLITSEHTHRTNDQHGRNRYYVETGTMTTLPCTPSDPQSNGDRDLPFRPSPTSAFVKYVKSDEHRFTSVPAWSSFSIHALLSGQSDDRQLMGTDQSSSSSSPGFLQLPRVSDPNETPSPTTTITPPAPIVPVERVRRRTHRQRRPRTTFSGEQTGRLEEEYRNTEYVSKSRRMKLAQTLNLTEGQIKIWFQNRRAKDKRIEKAHFGQRVRCDGYCTGTVSTSIGLPLFGHRFMALNMVATASMGVLGLPTVSEYHRSTYLDAKENGQEGDQDESEGIGDGNENGEKMNM